MLKIREGNKFTWAWAIVRGADNVDLSTATNIKFSYQFRDKAGRVNITEFTTSGNIITTKFLFTGVQGIVNLRLVCELPVIGMCTVDVDAFEIVASSEEASEGGEFSMTSDMAIALQGKSAYEVWLETHEGTLADYEAWLKQPAADAAASVQTVEQAVEAAEALRVTSEQGRATAEGLRVTAEGLRTGAELLRSGAESDRAGAELLRAGAEDAREGNEEDREQAEALRVQAEIDRQTNTGTAIQNAETATKNASDAAILANTKAGLANDAATNANTKAGLADTAAANANTKAGLADTAATNANNAATNINPAVINNEQVQAEIYNVLNARISALEALLANMVFANATINKVDVVNEFNIWGTTNLIKIFAVVPAITPDFVGQIYINTATNKVYVSTAIVNSGSWQLLN